MFSQKKPSPESYRRKERPEFNMHNLDCQRSEIKKTLTTLPGAVIVARFSITSGKG
jgi:hypothetical protein